MGTPPCSCGNCARFGWDPSPTPPSSCPAHHQQNRRQPVLGIHVRQVVRPAVVLVRVRLALRLDSEQKPAFVVGRTDPEEAVHPALQRPDLGEIGVEWLDRALLGEPDARLRHETGQEIRLLPEDPMYSVMLRTDHATERNRANTRSTPRRPHDQPYG